MLRGTIQLDISNVTKEAPAKSELLYIGGYQWWVSEDKQLICPSDDCSADSFLIVCNENCADRLWLCKVKYSTETKEGNSDWKKLNEYRRSRYWFNSYDNVTARNKRDGQGNPNSIKVDIEVEWNASQSNLPIVNSTLNMIFGGTTDLVPVNKFVLAGYSNYFYNFFFGELAAVSKRNDSNGNPIYDITEDLDFDSDQFRFVIHALLCMGPTVEQLGNITWSIEDKKSKIAQLKLAVKYQLQMFVNFAEKALIKLGPGTMELLALADQFTLAGLKDHCLASITPNEYCKEIGENTEIRAGLGKVTRDQLDAKLKECANKG